MLQKVKAQKQTLVHKGTEAEDQNQVEGKGDPVLGPVPFDAALFVIKQKGIFIEAVDALSS